MHKQFILAAGCPPYEHGNPEDVTQNVAPSTTLALEDAVVQAIESPEKVPIYHEGPGGGGTVFRAWNSGHTFDEDGPRVRFVITSVSNNHACVFMRQEYVRRGHVSTNYYDWRLVNILGKWFVFKSIVPSVITS